MDLIIGEYGTIIVEVIAGSSVITILSGIMTDAMTTWINTFISGLL